MVIHPMGNLKSQAGEYHDSLRSALIINMCLTRHRAPQWSLRCFPRLCASSLLGSPDFLCASVCTIGQNDLTWCTESDHQSLFHLHDKVSALLPWYSICRTVIVHDYPLMYYISTEKASTWGGGQLCAIYLHYDNTHLET